MPAATESANNQIRAVAADGNILTFPAGTEDAVVDRVMKDYTQKNIGPPTPTFGQGVRHYLEGSWEGLKQAGREIPHDAGQFLSDLWDSLKLRGPSPESQRERTEAQGRLLGKIGDVATFATGGFAGPETPPMARQLPAIEPTGRAAMGRPLSPAFEDMQKVGMTPNVPTATGARPLVPIFNPLKAMSFTPVSKGLQQNVMQAQQRAAQVADQMSPAIGAEQAGRSAQEAIRDFASNTEHDQINYGEFDRLMHGSRQADVSNTVRALRDLRNRYPHAPELDQVFGNSTLSQVLTAIEPRTTRIEPRIGGISGDYTATPGGTITTGGRLPFNELKNLRTRIRYMQKAPKLSADSIPQADIDDVYVALTRDMERAARARGPDAAEALKRANDQYRRHQEISKRLESIAGKDVSPERAFARLNAAATSRGSGDVALLETARDVITPEKWRDIGAAMVRRLGYPVTKAETEAGELSPEFSLLAFRNNWQSITPKAKDLLFGPQSLGTPRDTLETIARLGANKALTHKPGMADVATIATGGAMLGEGMIRALASGRLPIEELAGLGGIYLISKGLMSPRFARMFYQERMKSPGRRVPIPGGGNMPYAGQAAQAGAAALSGRRDTPKRQQERMREAYNANRRGDLDEMRRLARQPRRGTLTIAPRQEAPATP